MPLHLLGKKSWNVYNAENISRVQRDEAAAAAAEQAAEQRMQEVDAARRLAILRGETPPPLPEAEPEIDPSDKKFTRRDRDSSGFKSKKRKRAGEDDTDFEMRLARERAEMGGKVTAEIVQAKGAVEIVDKAGHIDLVGAPPTPAPAAEKNPEYEREAAKKKREMEDQYQMRFSNAAGRDGFSAGAPWYAKADSRRVALPADAAAITTKHDVIAEIGIEAPTTDIWGNDDPKRKVRAVQRINTDDPLAMMKTGARRVREVEKERRREAEEREQELKELRREERRREKRRREERRNRDKDEDDVRSRSHRSHHSDRRHEGSRRDDDRHSHRDDEPERRRDRDRDRDRDRERHRDRGRAEDRDREWEKSRHSHGDHEDRRRERRKHQDDGEHEVRRTSTAL